MDWALDWKNRIDFFLRGQFTWSRPVRVPRSQVGDRKLQGELQELFQKFHWQAQLGARKSPLTVADVGARTFVFGPAIEQLLLSFGYESEVHGIEIDAYRRFTDLRTRADYGNYYARQLKRGQFHAMDFLDWNVSVDGLFLLNPFVTLRPLLAWGLPKKHLKPNRLFQHAGARLRRRHGFLFLTAPNPEELEISHQGLTRNESFELKEAHEWHPKKTSIQQQPRYARLYQHSS